ncbi:hypothetical protein K503DRAFT_493183 [Rhizopogon vinicolor AM-OR11-026]|uniref:Uncharacterized protein n=1 Tax=Rhizopogon vinicolor AM-OR11-026 TaxID=1314800 RepID=A0A1B7N992_9AGAM|nr:hypothetical protein K503DRAFT_493183 [Rhizopogon vinicolor AM-OR11-026]
MKRKREKEKAMAAKNASSGSSRPSQSSVAQQSGGAAQAHPSVKMAGSERDDDGRKVQFTTIKHAY